MDFRKPLRWTALNKGISIGAFVVGAVLVAVGFAAGFGSAFSTLLSDPLNPGNAIESANPTLTLAFAVVGYVVWQFGKTYALFVTLPRAAGESAAEQFDTERVKSEILEVLDQRLSGMHTDIEEIRRDVEEARRGVQELKREEHAASFEEEEVIDPSPSGATATDSSSAPDGSGSDEQPSDPFQ